MLKALVNEARLRLDIQTQGPLLIKTGYNTIIGADMAPVLTYRNGQQEVYIPGSSLKGVFRSHIEKVVNSIKPQTACNPLLRPNENDSRDDKHLYRPACSSDDKTPTFEVYSKLCPTCRLFGSTAFGSRIAIEDAYLPENTTGRKTLIEHRDGVAIDRLTGGASNRAKFDLDVVTDGTTFGSIIHLRNFEIWQLGMLFVILQDLEDELIRIGSGRSRGLGKIKGRISEQPEEGGFHAGGVVLSTMRSAKDEEKENELRGLGYWLGNEAETYGTQRDDVLTLLKPVKHTPRGIRNIRSFTGDALTSLKEQSIEIFVTRMQQWPSASVATLGTSQAQRR